MSNLSCWEILIENPKFGNFKADIPLVNWIGKIMDKNTLVWWRFFRMQKTWFCIKKHQKHPNSKNDLKSRLGALIKELWAILLLANFGMKTPSSGVQKSSDFSCSEIWLINWSLKYGKFNADIIVLNWMGKIVDKNNLVCTIATLFHNHNLALLIRTAIQRCL